MSDTKNTPRSRRKRVVQSRLVRRWGVYCAATLAADPKALPRYTYLTKEAAEKSLPQMDRECASRAKHFVKIIPPNAEPIHGEKDA